MVGVAVLGASGYSGGELLRLIAGHPEFDLIGAGARGQVGRRIGSVHPHLAEYRDLLLASNESPCLLEADLVFMCLPHGAFATSGGLAPVIESGSRVIDLAADHRLRSEAQWRAYYGSAQYQPAWVYGLPELPGRRSVIAGARRVANPGCHATAVELALAPLVSAGILSADPVTVVAVSGASGAGRRPEEDLLASAVMGSVRAYKVGGIHQHTPEIEQELGDLTGRPFEVIFTPILAPMPRGILATCIGRSTRPIAGDEPNDVLRAAYFDEPFVKVLDGEDWPSSGATVGSNAALVRAYGDARTGRITVICALDNLGKGAAGQAVQNANLMLGLREDLGLTTQGVWP